MSRETLSVLTRQCQEIFLREKQKLTKLISQISQRRHPVFLLLEKIQ